MLMNRTVTGKADRVKLAQKDRRRTGTLFKDLGGGRGSGGHNNASGAGEDEGRQLKMDCLKCDEVA